MVPSDQVRMTAVHVLNSYRQSELWAPALTDATLQTPDDSVEPLLGGGTEYFIFELKRADGITARMAFDLAGKLLEAEGVKRANARLQPFLEPVTVKWWALNRTYRKVWKPCNQSTSRLRPFWEVSDPQGTRYLRVDGVMFDELTVKIGIG